MTDEERYQQLKPLFEYLFGPALRSAEKRGYILTEKDLEGVRERRAKLLKGDG